MPTITATRHIDAPVGRVFDAVAHIENFRKAVSHITKVELLSETRTGVGVRFRETRLMKGKEATTELEVTEYVENDRVRLVADSHGTVWDTAFTVKPDGEGTELTMVMEARAYKLRAKMMNAIVMGMVRKEVEKDMDAVKTYCEGQSGEAAIA